MKNIILSTFSLVTLILLLGVTADLQAQSEVTINASASVEAAIVLTEVVADVNFGTVSNTPADVPTLDATSTGNSFVGPGASMAEYGVEAATDIYVEISSSSVTLGDGSSNTITYSPAVYGSNSSTTAGTADEIIAPGSTNSGTTSSQDEITVGTAGGFDYYLFIGGTLDLSGAVNGTSYSSDALNGDGPLTLTVTYF